MRFPIVGDIASINVVSVDIDCSISEAIAKMLEQEHRNVVVIDGRDYYILTVMDILNLEGKDLSISLRDLTLDKIPTVHKSKNVLDTLYLLNEKVEYVCVVNTDGSLYGLMTHTDITSNMDPDTLMDTYLLEDLLKIGKRMKSVEKDDKTTDMIQDMIANSFDNAIVVEDSKPVGILTTKDIMWLIKNKEDLELPVSEFMTTPVNTISKKSSIKDALTFITQKRYKRAIVVNDDGTLSGIIAQKDIISLTYTRWAMIMREYQDELSDMNTMLEDKNKEYEKKASIDSLTGLYNRYKFTELYNSSYTSMIQRHNDMSLILLDIDFFKKVNDNFGHNIGDQVLIKVAHSLLKTLRNIDIVCRWGGEEFIVLLPTAALEIATDLAEKLRQNISEVEIELVGHVNASFGVSQVREGETMEAVIDRADKALYLAKKSGRNCVKTENDL